MTALARKDFASLLDDLVAARDDIEPGNQMPPSIPFDYLAVAEELHSKRLTVADEVVEAEYGEMSSEDFTAFLFQSAVAAAKDEDAAMTELPVDPQAILAELDLDHADVDLGQVRRRFAFANHPDRVAPQQRERALARMQIANMLIDAAANR